jgi:hypothetical protein
MAYFAARKNSKFSKLNSSNREFDICTIQNLVNSIFRIENVRLLPIQNLKNLKTWEEVKLFILFQNESN